MHVELSKILIKSFKLFDNNNAGLLSADKLFFALGGELGKWRKYLARFDKDKDGNITFDEFKRIMLNSENDH